MWRYGDRKTWDWNAVTNSRWQRRATVGLFMLLSSWAASLPTIRAAQLAQESLLLSWARIPRRLLASGDTSPVLVRLPDPGSPEAQRLRVRATVSVEVPSRTSTPEPLAGVRGLVRTGDGGFLLAEASRSRLQSFSATGVPRASAGRPGAGPGEFTAMLAMARCGPQAVVVQDPALNRASFFSVQPRYEAVTPLPAGFNSDPILGCGEQRRLIMLNHQPKSIPAEKGLVRTAAALVMARHAGGVDTIATMAGTDFVFARRAPGYVDLPLGQRALAGVGTKLIAAGSSSDGVISLFDLAGRRIHRLRIETARRRPSANEVQQAYTERVSLEYRRETQQLLTAVLQEAPVAALLPMIEELRVALDDHLWIRAFPPENSQTASWYVLSPTGQLKGVVSLSRHFTPLEIGGNYILGVNHDAYGVETVQLMALGVDLPPRHEIRE